MRHLILALLIAVSIMGIARADSYDASGIPVAQDEQEARQCYINSMNEWNRVMATTPLNTQALTHTYTLFAFCAKVALKTGHVLKNGDRIPWLFDYFADTIGALWAQVQLTAATTGGVRCTHIALANDLAQQALDTTSGLDDPSLQQFNYDWPSFIDKLRTQALSCGVKPVSV